MEVITNKDKIEHLLNNGVAEVVEREHLQDVLLAGKQLRIKFGIDPTSPKLHLGHAVPLRKLREFQELGHIAVLIIGDFTASVGDPSGRSEARKPLTSKQIEEHMKSYLEQAGKIIDLQSAEVHYNTEWFSKQKADLILRLGMSATYQQIRRRADFQKRIEADEDISMLELLYPLLQGYDSVEVRADVEIGGTDQKFNLLMGRRIQRSFHVAEQDIITVPILEGLDGIRKMSKSLGNYIGLTDAANDMFAKAMSIPDNLISRYFELCTSLGANEAQELSPRDRKIQLASEITKIYHGEQVAREAQENFEKLFSKKEIPDDVPTLVIEGETNALDVIIKSGVTESKSEARRLIEQGGLHINDIQEKDPKAELDLTDGDVIRIGKRHFFRVKR